MTPFRICLDLNVWVSGFLARANGLQGTATQSVIQAVQDGRAGIGPVQLVVSHTMLSRLQDVLLAKGASRDETASFIAQIVGFARLGPAAEFPHVTLGGGVEPTRDAVMPRYDPYDPDLVPPRSDPEDGRVLDTALGGRADALVTSNFADFAHHQDAVVVFQRVHIRNTAGHRFHVVRPQEMAAWLRTGSPPWASTQEGDAAHVSSGLSQ